MEFTAKDCALLIRPVHNGWVLTLFKSPLYIMGSSEVPRVEEFVFVFDNKADLESKIQEFIDNPNNMLGKMNMSVTA